MPIVSKCHDSIQTAMNSIDPPRDTSIVIEKYKSGDVPPGDFNFEDMQDPRSMLSADALANCGPTNLNLYPRKREIERQMAAIEAELAKNQKELMSLNQMMETYQNQPKFGNSKKFLSEIQKLHSSVTELESALTSLRAEHVVVEERLEALKNRNQSPILRLQRGSSSHSSGSIKSSNLSISSSNNQRVYDIPFPNSSDKFSSNSDKFSSNSDDYDEIPPPPPEVLTSDTMSSMSSPSETSTEPELRKCVALYSYNNANMEESNIPMEAEEEFYVVDEDCDGWTRVRRVVPNPNFGEEGYVPTTWIRILE